MDALHSSGMSLNFYQTTRDHIPEDGTLHSQRCENLNYNINQMILSNKSIVNLDPHQKVYEVTSASK
jgi:hypothetical protein